MKTEFFIEFDGEQINYMQLIDTAKESWKAENKLVKDISTLNIYFKPSERSCYCVINDEYKCDFQI